MSTDRIPLRHIHLEDTVTDTDRATVWPPTIAALAADHGDLARHLDHLDATVRDIRHQRDQARTTLAIMHTVRDRLDRELEQTRADRDRAVTEARTTGQQLHLTQETHRRTLTAVRQELAEARAEVEEVATELADERTAHQRTLEQLAIANPADGEIVRIDCDGDTWRQRPDGRWRYEGERDRTLDDLERDFGPTRLVRLVPVPAEPTPAPDEDAGCRTAPGMCTIDWHNHPAPPCPGDPWCRAGHRCDHHRPTPASGEG